MTICRIVYKKILISVFPFISLIIFVSFAYGQWGIVAPPSVSENWWLIGVHFTSPTEGWAVGEDESNQRGVLLHYSAGTWTSISPPSVSENWVLLGVYFISPDEGWAVGPDHSNVGGTLLHYSGNTWTSVSAGKPWLSGVHFTSPTEGWAVGKDPSNGGGALLHYSGGTWTFVLPPFVSSFWALFGVHFTSPTEGWAVGEDFSPLHSIGGVLLHFSGSTWTSVPLPAACAITFCYPIGVHFTSPDEGWAVGATLQTGMLLHYSGNTWTLMSPPSVSTGWWLSGVHFTASGKGWAVGRDYSDDTNSRGILLRYFPISPGEGTIGTEFTITGSGFGKKRGEVLLGSIVLKIIQWTDELIECRLTKALSPGTYDLTIKPQARGSSPLTISNGFTVKAPEIDFVNPVSGSVGDEITISGSFFGTKKGKVTLGGKRILRVPIWTMDPATGESEIRFVVPKGLSLGTTKLEVTNSVGADTANFTIN